MLPSLTTAPTLRLCSQCGTRETDDQLRITRGTTCTTCGRCYGCGGLVGCTCGVRITARATSSTGYMRCVSTPWRDELDAPELPPSHDIGGEG